MIQQQFGAESQAAGGAQAPTTLAMPAIISNQPSQYSPQANYYQQQLIKSAQQQFAASARQTPIYVPKPAYYGQNSSQLSSHIQQQPQSQQQPLYQPRPVHQSFYQQQHSPATLSRPIQANGQVHQVAGVGLSVQQVPSIQMNDVLAQSPQTDNQRHQQQMQQLIMSYQQHQRINNTDLIQPTQQSSYMSLPGQEQLVQQHVDVRWSQIDHQRQLQPAIAHPTSNERASRARYSDRDSLSTLSRFNQLDERRSFTMRSQYTNANHASRLRQFSFVKLTSEAFKRILGIGAGSNNNALSPLMADERKINQNLQRNLNLSASEGNSSKSIQPFNQTQHSSNKVTIIDSGDDYYFKKKVFRYQMMILRLISLLSAAIIILSPVVMLLIPKMEFLFHHQDFTDQTTSTTQVGTFDGGQNVGPSITHAVGLTGNSKQTQQQQQSYFTPQPQWRISECNSDCDGPLIGFVVRFIMLCIAYWAIFFRAQTATLPRIDFYRCLLTSTAILLTIAYWLFFIFRVFDKRYNDFELQYMTIVQFALSMLESLILLHYLAVILLEIRHRKKVYCLKVIRSPDGVSQYYSCGVLSIQKCAQFVLEKYHRDFECFGPYKEQLIELEDQLAQNSVSGGHRNEHGDDKSPRSRPSSPANSHRDYTLNGKSSRQSGFRASRHHSRSGTSTGHHRSPSISPTRSTRSRSQRKSLDAEKGNSRSSKIKLYQVDLNPPEQHTSSESQDKSGGKSFQEQTQTENKREENDSNIADQSSDATSRLKESSLETIRAANSTSDLIIQPKTSASLKPSSSRDRSHEDQVRQGPRDETESVRSVRSRRSASRSHNRHHHKHRENSTHRTGEHFESSDDRGHSHSHQIIQLTESSSDSLEDHERKLRRRKFRLLVAVQDAFDQVKQIDEANQAPQLDPNVTITMQQPKQQALGPNQAARSLYPTIARSLQKYLRLTKQTGRHNLQSIYQHLSKCILYRLSARAFIEKFVNLDPVWQQSETNLFANCTLDEPSVEKSYRMADDLEINSWSLVSDTLLSRQISSGTFFLLKQGHISLLVTVAKLPHLNLSEQVIDQKSCKFTLGSDSETSTV